MPRAKKPKKPPESPRLPKTFDAAALQRAFETYTRSSTLGTWSVDAVLAAQDAQVRGCFRQPVALARKLLCDAAIYSAALNRMAPHRGLPRDVVSVAELAGSPENIRIEAKATFASDTSNCLSTGVLADTFDRLAWHAVSIDQTHWEARIDGSRLDPFVQSWPLEDVEYSEQDKCLYAITTEGRVRIVHGDGRWIVTAKHADRPWRYGALVPLTSIAVSRPFAIMARSNNAKSHGDSKWIGRLPPGIPLDHPDADAMLEQMLKLYEVRRAMLIPHESEVKRDEAMSQNWQIFKEIIESDNKDAARIFLGQDGTINDAGGNYIKSKTLFGVRNDIVESDVNTVGACMSTGLLRPWSLINFGRWDHLSLSWLMPDADEDARRESTAKRRQAFWLEIESAKKNGAIVDQAYMNNAWAAIVGGSDSPKLANTSPNGADFFSYELDGGVFTINEFRERKGLPPVPWGNVTKPERDAQLAAAAASLPPTPAANREPLTPVSQAA